MSSPPVINPGNAVENVATLTALLDEAKMDEYDSLFAALLAYREAMKNPPENDGFVAAWTTFKAKAKKEMITELKEKTSFEEFVLLVRRLSKVLADGPALWKILHDMEEGPLKVTLHQSQLMCAEFWSPDQLFELGFDRFSRHPSCSMKNANNEEAVIDIFYLVTGFLLGCNLPKSYVAELPSYHAMITEMLMKFINITDFDAHRFVWLVDVIHTHLRLEESVMMQILVEVITSAMESPKEKSIMNKLYKACVMSTSTVMRKMDVVKQTINKLTQIVLLDQEQFLRKYVFCCFVSCSWDEPRTHNHTDAFRCWRLYIMNVAARMKERPEYPVDMMFDLIDESLRLFEGYYAEVQPSKSNALPMRMDIFGIVETCASHGPMELPEDVLRRMWYLLLIAAVSGATDQQIEGYRPALHDEYDTPFLELDRNKSEFADYTLALSRISKKFEKEASVLPVMADFVRQKYKQ